MASDGGHLAVEMESHRLHKLPHTDGKTWRREGEKDKRGGCLKAKVFDRQAVTVYIGWYICFVVLRNVTLLLTA